MGWWVGVLPYVVRCRGGRRAPCAPCRGGGHRGRTCIVEVGWAGGWVGLGSGLGRVGLGWVGLRWVGGWASCLLERQEVVLPAQGTLVPEVVCGGHGCLLRGWGWGFVGWFVCVGGVCVMQCAGSGWVQRRQGFWNQAHFPARGRQTALPPSVVPKAVGAYRRASLFVWGR